MKTIYFIYICITFSSACFSQSWTRCSNGLPADTAVLSLTQTGNVLFAGTEKAGVYKSDDGGISWVSMPHHASLRNSQTWSMTSIDTFIFAGQRGSGILKTSVHGNQWSAMNNGILSGTKMIQDIIAVQGRLYAASWGGGVYVSSDTANSWTQLYNNLGLNDKKVLSLCHNSKYLFAGTAGINTAMPDTGVIFITALSGGSSWNVINNGLARNGAHLEATLSMDANDSMVFSGHDDVGIHRSTDNGLLWVQSPGTNLNGDIFSIKIAGNQVFYGTTYGGIYTSNDQGQTFSANNNGLKYQSKTIPYWVNDLMISGSYIYAATDIGVFRQALPIPLAVKNLSSAAYELSISPNPGTGIFYVKSNRTINAVFISDLNGRTVFSAHPESNTFETDTRQLPGGSYFMSLSDGKQNIHAKIFLVK